MNKLCSLIGVTLVTSGDSLWSNKKQRSVKIVDVKQHEGKNETTYSVYFDTSTWNVQRDGLIYTDNGFIQSAREVSGIQNLNYSEQGMQGEDFVHFVDGDW